VSKVKLGAHKRELEHTQRLLRKREQRDGLIALIETWEQAGDAAEIRRLHAKLRLVKQELLYMMK
jgi:hypothetical protein